MHRALGLQNGGTLRAYLKVDSFPQTLPTFHTSTPFTGVKNPRRKGRERERGRLLLERKPEYSDNCRDWSIARGR
jgi:hypothetical protein